MNFRISGILAISGSGRLFVKRIFNLKFKMTLQFYHFKASPPSRIVLLTIRNLGLENVQTNIVNLFKREQNSPEYYKLNPLNKVPLLQDDDFIITESRAIAQYLVESQAPDSGLYPNDPKIRALINQRMYYDATVAFPTIIDVVVSAS